MADKAGKDIKLVTDPAEIEHIARHEKTHQQALEAAGRLAREAKTIARLIAKAESGSLFNIVWHKIEGFQDISGGLLRGQVMESRDKSGRHYGLTAEVDYRRLYEINPARKEKLQDKSDISLEFNQHRATIFSIGSYDSFSAAQAKLYLIDQYFMHVLAEKGAEHTLLEVLANGVALKDDPGHADGQSYSDALRTARLVEVFRTAAVDSSNPEFRQVVGNLARALVGELGLEARRSEKREAGLMNVRIDFGKEIGRFSFTEGDRHRTARLCHEIRSGGASSYRQKFDGELTRENLQKIFIDWLAAAARERGTITAAEFGNLHGEIKAIKGVPLRTSRLGILSPFGAANGGSGPHMN